MLIGSCVFPIDTLCLPRVRGLCRGLDRIDQPGSLDNIFSYSSDGSNVGIAILDTCVRVRVRVRE